MINGHFHSSLARPEIFPEVIMGNRNHFPSTNLLTSNHVLNTRIMRVVDAQADYSDIRLTYCNWTLALGGDYLTANTDITVKASIEYNGTIYPVTFGGANTAALVVGDSVTSDPVAGLVLPAGAVYYERVQRVGQVGSNRYAYGHGAYSIFGEGQLTGSDEGVDYTDGSEGRGAEATATVDGSGTITGITITNGGGNYTDVPSMTAWEVQPDGTIRTSAIGWANRSAGVVVSATLSGGDRTGWTNPNIVFTGGGGFGQTTTSYGAAAVRGKPNARAKSLLMVGDSIMRGYTSTDARGSARRDFGIYERAVSGDCGVLNIASSGGMFANYINTTPLYDKTFDFLDSLPSNTITHALIALGTNDIDAGANIASMQSRYNAMHTFLKAKNYLVSAATIIPRATSTDGFLSVENQTPVAGFEVGGVRDQYNALHRADAYNLDWPLVDADLVFRDDTQTDALKVVGGDNISTDGIHPNTEGLPYGGANLNVEIST